MFASRMKTIAVFFGGLLSILFGRLVHLQVFQHDQHRRAADQILLNAPIDVPCVRGSIVDRGGKVLAQDVPRWEIRLDYRILTMDEDYLESLAEKLLKQKHYPGCDSIDEVDAALDADLEEMWNELALFARVSRSRLQERVTAIIDRVEAIYDDVHKRKGYPERVYEQIQDHTLIDELDDQRQIDARQRFARWPWVKIEDSVERQYPGGPPFAHLLGRMGRITAEQIRNDPFIDDPLKRYRADDHLGIAGLERSAEHRLRGQRGVFRTDRKGTVVEDIPPTRGHDARLTLRSDLQQQLFGLLANNLEYPSRGGAIAVIHVPTRELLALVSFPSYDPDRFDEDYDSLRSNTRDLPLWPRAVANRFAPGSIVKPLTCLAGLSSQVVTPDSRFTCTGSLFPNQPDRYRCWPIAGTRQRKQHGTVDMEEAIAGSCNVYMYHVGERVGVETLSSFFKMVGFGEKAGTGLAEEAKGINPTPQWLYSNRGSRPSVGDARHYAIGQGELSVTPVQAANLMATYASGEYQPVCLLADASPAPSWQLPITDSQWRTIRHGIYRVVNDPNGTAYDYARIDPACGYALCGKTGSAETPRLHTSYLVRYADAQGIEQTVSIPAGSRSQARDDFERQFPKVDLNSIKVEDEGFWPTVLSEDGRNYSHAWFGGFLQPLNSSGLPDESRAPPIAFSILVEFGGSGARTAGPLAQKVCQSLIETLGPDLDPDFGSPLPTVGP